MNAYEVIGVVLLLVGAAGSGFIFGHMAGVYDAQRQRVTSVRDEYESHQPDPYVSQYTDRHTKP